MKKIYKCLVDGDPRDCITIDNEESNSNLFWFETITYIEGEQTSNIVAISKENALDLAHAIINELQ
jgi:hypothetical protein